MKALVVGFGSIGKRHARLLGELGCMVAVVSSRKIEWPDVFHDLQTALRHWAPDYVVVANRTNEHFDTLSALVEAGYKNRVLVEKPLFDHVTQVPDYGFSSLAVAYNLRFHPLITRLHSFLEDQQPVAANAYVGQYLPQWRLTTDYRNAYSAKKAEGGGVLRDLSHELDYMNWLFGSWVRLTAQGGHFSELEIDSDDAFSLLVEMGNCPVVGIHVNYLDRVLRREVIVHTQAHSVRVDFVQGTFSIDGEIEKIDVERDQTYIGEHRAMLEGGDSNLCSLHEGLEVMEMINYAETAAVKKIWVEKS